MRETRGGVDVLISLLDEHAAAVRQALLHPRNQRAGTLEQAGIRALVLQRVVEVQRGVIRDEILGAELAARPETPLGPLGLDAQILADAVGAADTGAIVVLAVAALRY